jgi:hypothetical protein
MPEGVFTKTELLNLYISRYPVQSIAEKQKIGKIIQ